MKNLLIILLLTPISLYTWSQVNLSAKWPQIEPDTFSKEARTFNMQMRSQTNTSAHALNSNNCLGNPKVPVWFDHKGYQIDSSGNNIRNIKVSRNPEQVLITNDDQYACIRCFLSNTVEFIKISTGELVKSFLIPSPKYFILSHDGSKLIVASLSSDPFPADPPNDDCLNFIINLYGKSILTTINIASLEIFKTDTINTLSISRLLQSPDDSIIYLQGKEVIEFNLATSSIIRRWPFAQQIWHSNIDNKNKRIFLTTIDSAGQMQLKAIDLSSGDILSAPLYYPNGEMAGATYIGMDTLSNRIFVQGKVQPYSEILVFDAISLNQLNPIDSANLLYDCFLACPSLGSIFVGAGYPDNTVELDYLTLKRRKILPLPIYTHWHSLLLNDDKTRLFTFQYGASEDALSIINPAQFLDITAYDIKTGDLWQYITTDQKYGCSYARSLATTKDGRYIIATNSPENTVSILDLSHVGFDETNISNLLEVYPNPTSGVITVSINKQLDSDYIIEVYNVLGVLLKKISKAIDETNFVVDLTQYHKGQYLLHFISRNQSCLQKIIKI